MTATLEEGSGASAGLTLSRKPQSASGYYGVRPNGKKGWQARVYKPVKKSWDNVGTYPTPEQAATAAAIAKKETEAGRGHFYSPLKTRHKKGALPTTPRLASTSDHACSRVAWRAFRGSPTPDRDPERPAVTRVRLEHMHGRHPLAPRPPDRFRLSVRPPSTCCDRVFAHPRVTGKAASSYSFGSNELENVGPPCEMAVQTSAGARAVRCAAPKPSDRAHALVRCECTRMCVPGIWCLCGRVVGLVSPVADAPAAPVPSPWQWMSL